jgi:hypothetical protein
MKTWEEEMVDNYIKKKEGQMLEGILRKAGFDERGHFKASIEIEPGKVWDRDVEVVGEQTKCMQWVGKHIIADEIPQAKNPKYKQLINVRLAEKVSAPAGEPVVQNNYASRFTQDEVGRQKCRCSIIESVCTLFSGSKTVTIDAMIKTCRAFEKYVYEASLIDEAIKLGATPEDELPF